MIKQIGTEKDTAPFGPKIKAQKKNAFSRNTDTKALCIIHVLYNLHPKLTCISCISYT